MATIEYYVQAAQHRVQPMRRDRGDFSLPDAKERCAAWQRSSVAHG